MKNLLNKAEISKEEEMAKIILSTFHKANAVVFAVTKFGADRLILFADKNPKDEQVKELETLEKSFKPVLQISKIRVDPYNVVQIATKAVEAIDLLSDNDELIVNISGGRKTMALGLLYAAYARVKKIKKIAYCSEEKNIIFLPKLSFNLTPSQQKVMEAIQEGKNKTIMQLAEKIKISRGMLYRNIKELQDLGLLEEDDGLKLTDAGRISVL